MIISIKLQVQPSQMFSIAVVARAAHRLPRLYLLEVGALVGCQFSLLLDVVFPSNKIQRFRWQRLWDNIGMNGGEGDLRFSNSKKTPMECCHGGEGEVRCGHQ